MNRRKIIFQLVVVAAALLFASSALLSIQLARHLIAFKPAFVFWVILTVAFQIPFILIPLDRGRTLGVLIDSLPQDFIHLMVGVNMTNVFLSFLSPILFLLPAPGRVYDYFPYLFLAFILVVVYRSAYRITEKNITIPISGMPNSWQPLTILHLSDVHAGPFMRPARLRRIVEELNRRGGFDICVITGDVVNHSAEDLKWVLPILEEIKSPLGIYASIGNHEYIEDEESIKKTYARSNIQLIFESSVLVSDGRRNVRLVGLDYPFSQYKIAAEEVKRCLNASYHYSPPIDGELKVLLSHHPEGFKGGREAGVPLTLSGHTHGGQVIMFGKNLITPFVHYKRGIYRKDDKYLFVNSGLGNWLPFRVNCPCEYAMIKVVGNKS